MSTLLLEQVSRVLAGQAATPESARAEAVQKYAEILRRHESPAAGDAEELAYLLKTLGIGPAEVSSDIGAMKAERAALASMAPRARLRDLEAAWAEARRRTGEADEAHRRAEEAEGQAMGAFRREEGVTAIARTRFNENRQKNPRAFPDGTLGQEAIADLAESLPPAPPPADTPTPTPAPPDDAGAGDGAPGVGRPVPRGDHPDFAPGTLAGVGAARARR